MAHDFDINGVKYQSGKLSALRQFHVSRRLVPVLSGLADSFTLFKKDPLAAIAPVTAAISKLSDADSNYVIFNCLDVVRRQSGVGWQRVATGEQLQFEDIDMPTMLRIVWEVLQDNFAGFISALPTASPGEAAKE